MSEPASAKRCPDCGATMPESSPEGLCPKCLMVAAAVPTEAGGHEGRPAAPALDVVAAAFPQFEVLELIGQGGMGCVFKARQPQLNRFVALKILPEALARDAAFAARFTREAQALAALSHPSIVTIHDFGQANGFFYLLMEFVDGVNLRQALRGGRFTPEQALTVVPPICDALQYAHERGIVHRDIKPENLLLDREGRVKIADFGIAKMLGAPASGEAIALQQTAAGTPQYMAPEQRSDPGHTDHRADIYSLGVVLYELLTGELPGAKLQPPSARVQIDVRLDEVVLRALEREPERRYATAHEFKTNVETVATPNAAGSQSERPGAHSATVEREVSVRDSARGFARLALVLFLTGTLGALLLLSISSRHDLVLIFAATALVFAQVFGILGWRHGLGKGVVITSVSIVAAIFGIFMVREGLVAPSARRAAMKAEQLKREAVEKAAAERAAAISNKNSDQPAVLPRDVVDQWLAHVKAGSTEDMWNLTTRESGGAGSVDLRNTWEFEKIRAYTLAVASNAAMIVTTRYKDNAGRERQIVLTLVPRDGRWLIRENWIMTPENAENRLAGFVAGANARFDVRRSDIVGRWIVPFFAPAQFDFGDDGHFSTSYRVVGGGRTNLTGTWALLDDRLSYTTSAGGVTGRVVNVRQDFLQLEFGDGNVGSYQRVKDRPTTGQATPGFEPMKELVLGGGQFLSFRKGRVYTSKPTTEGSVSVSQEAGEFFIHVDGTYGVVLAKEKGIEQWDTKTAAELIQDYNDAGFALLPSERFTRAAIQPEKLPLTILLPGAGFLQVIELIAGATPGVKLRYKLVAP